MIGKAATSTLRIDKLGGIRLGDTTNDINPPKIITSNKQDPDLLIQRDVFYDSPSISSISEEKISANKLSDRLKRELRVEIANQNGKTYSFIGNKMSISGSKFIGIQQDQFTITIQNANLPLFAKAINNGYLFISVYLEKDLIFFGKIKALNTARESVVEKTIEMICLTRVTDLLADMVSPITVNTGANIWSILSQAIGASQEEITDSNKFSRDVKFKVQNVPEQFKNLTFEEGRSFSGYKKTVIDDIIKVANDQISRTANTNLPWIDYNYEQNGIINLFTPYESLDVINLKPSNGLLDFPTVTEDSISFNSIFIDKLIPGRVVRLNNALFKTLGNETAFIFGFDPHGEYVITEVRYSFRNYANEYTISCKARPLSKYNNFTASLGG